MFSVVVARAKQLVTDDRGAEEGLSKVLIFALISLPIIGVVMFFGKQTWNWALKQWKTFMGTGEGVSSKPPGP